MATLTYDVWGHTDVGRTRERNEDSLYFHEATDTSPDEMLLQENGILVAVAYSAFGIIVNFPFLLPFALYLSYLRHTRDSIWPGVFANSVFVASNIFIPFLF